MVLNNSKTILYNYLFLMRRNTMIVKDWCSFCGECAGVCPRNLIIVKEYKLIFIDEDCRDCETCVKACPIDALEKEE